MSTMESTRLALVLLSLVACALSGPISVQRPETSCARTCTDSNKFKYTPGSTYEFEYNVQTHTSMEGATDEKAALGIRATADIEVLSKCDFALKLRDVKLYRSDLDNSSPMMFADTTGEFRRLLESHPLRFSFQDGVVEEICPDEAEIPWALNIKKGVLSSIQNTMDNLDKDQKVHESDVTGNCHTEYKVTSRGWYSSTVKKTKDLLGCTDRHGYKSVLQATPYRVPSEIQSWPLMKSEHECEQQLAKEGYPQSTLCTETHVFRPFSNNKNGAVTKVLQRMTYKTQRHGVSTRPEYIRKRGNIYFEHAYAPGDNSGSRRDAEWKLQEICAATRDDIRPEVPRMFSQLVYIMKNLDAASLRDIYRQLQQGSFCRTNNKRTTKFFLDAIPMTGTSASVQILKEMLLNKDVKDLQADMWLTSLSLIQYPTQEMLEEAKALLDDLEISDKAMLPVTTLVNNYCSQRLSCADEHAVTNIISSLERNIGYGCYVRDKNLEKTLLTLRAMGNAGHVERISRIVSNCFTRSGNPMEVRVAAIKAFRRLPCSADRSELMSLYRDTDEDSEVRIAAYLAIMQCPSENILDIVKRTLEYEKANQVGSFVWSHLTNLMESSSPHKQGIRSILTDQTLQKEFDLEKMKYSRNYEGSLFLEKFNTGAEIESNLIFSSKSFIPRSAMVNLTVDLFGQSMNLFEMGGRMEGLEYLLETYLGPYGYFGDKKSKRSQSQIKAKLDQLRGSMYMRMFGNEMSYMHFKGLESLTSGKSFNILDFLIKLSKDHDYSFTQSVMILDSSMIIPTSSGLPLNLIVNGTATVDLKAAGKVDLRKVSSNPRSLLVEGHIQPSGAIQIAGTMSIDAHVTKTGMKVINTWHSSTALKGRIELNRGKILSAEIDMPQDKMEILDVKTAFFNIHGDTEKEQKLITDNRKVVRMCTGSRIAKVTGLEACAEFQFANASMLDNSPYFPFTGPFSFEMTLLKRDTHSGYKLLAKRSENKASSVAQLAFDTPGSRVDRALSFDLTMNYKQKQLDVKMVSPWKKGTLKGSIVTENNELGLTGRLVVDEEKEYAVTSELKMNKDKDTYTYIPRVEIIRPKTDSIILSGRINAKRYKMADIDLTLTGITRNPMTLNTNLQRTKTETSMKGMFALSRKQAYSLDAGLIHQSQGQKKTNLKLVPTLVIRTPTRDLVSLTGSADYKAEKSFKADMTLSIDTILNKPVSMRCDIRKSTGKRRRYTANFYITSKYLSAKANGLLDFKKKGVTASRIVVDYNMPKLKSYKQNKLTFSSKFTDRSTNSLMKYTLNANLEAKKTPEINFQTDIDLNHNRRHSAAAFDLKYGKNFKDVNNRVSASAVVNRKLSWKAATLDYTGKAKYLPLGIDVQLKGNHKHDRRDLASSMSLGYGKGKSVNAALKLKDDSTKMKKMTGDFTLSYPGKKIDVKTDLMQPSKKQYIHTLSMKMDKQKSSVTTTYVRHKGDAHEVTSDIHLPFMDPVRVSGLIDPDLTDFRLAGQIEKQKNIYGLTTTYKYSKTPSGKWTLDITYPTRHITMEVEGSKIGSQYKGKIDTKWDADKDIKQRLVLNGKIDYQSGDNIDSFLAVKYPTRSLQFNFRHRGGQKYTTHADFSWTSKKQIVVETTFSNQQTWSSRIIDGTITLKTPFRKYEEMSAEFSSSNIRDKYDAKAKAIWGSQRDQVAATVSIKKPFSLQKVDISVSGTSTFAGYRRMSADITHTLGSTINTNIKGSLERKNLEIAITGENRGDAYRRDVEGTVSFKSNIRDYESGVLRVSHNDDARKFVTDVSFDLNGKQYLYDLDMTHYRSGWQIQNNGKLLLSSPYYRMSTTWQHRNINNNIKTTFTSDWGNNKLHFDLSGSHDTSPRIKTIGSVILQTPWEPVRDIDFNLNNEFGRGFIRSSTIIKHDRRVKASALINYIGSTGLADFDFTVTTPYTENIIGKVNARYNEHPMTGHAEFQWSPDRKFSADGSLSAAFSDNLDGSLRITTPYRTARRIILKATHKKEGLQWISTGSFDYGLQKSYEVESRVQIEGMKKVWAKIETPLEDYRSFQGGIEYQGGLFDFSSRADVSIQPVLGKFAGNLNWNWDSDLTGKLRLDTPFAEFPYFQVVVTSEMTRRGRHSRIEAEYYPRQALSFDAIYKFGGPIIMDFTINTPYQNMESMSASFRHAFGRSAIQTHAEASYGTYKKMEGDFRLQWNRDIDGSLTIKTPFEGYEINKITLRHEGSLDDFKSHGEVEFARQKFEMDADFNSGYSSSGNLVMKTPFTDFDEIKVTFKKRGHLYNFRGSSSITYGISRIQASFQNQFSVGKLDTALVIKAPFWNDIRLKVDHDGNLEKFTSKLIGSMGSGYTIFSDTAFSFGNPLLDLSSVFKYKYGGSGNNVEIVFHKDGSLEDMNARLIGTLDGDQIELAGSLKTRDKIEGIFTIQTPFQDFRDIGLSVGHSGNLERFISEGKIRYMDGQELEGKINFFQYGIKRIQTKVELRTPFIGYENMAAEYKHSLTDDSFTSNSEINYGNGKKIVADIRALMANKISMNAIIKTPFKTYELSRVVLSHEGTLSNCQNHAEIEFAGKTITADATVDHGNSKTGNLAVISNIPNLENMKISYTLSGKWRNLKANAGLVLGDAVYDGVLSHRLIGERLATSATFRNPYTDDIVFDIDHTGRSGGFTTKASASIGVLTSFSSDTVFTTRGNVIDLNSGIVYKLSGAGDQIGITFHKEGDISDIKLDLSGKYNRKNVDISASLKTSDGVHGDLVVKTPFTDFRNIGLTFDHSGNLGRFTSEGKVRYMDGKEISGKIKHYKYQWRRIESSAEINTPIEGYEFTKVEYIHVGDDDGLTCNAGIEYGRGQKITGDLRAALSPKFDFQLKTRTPFTGYEDMSATASFENNYQNYKLDSALNAGSGRKFTIFSQVDVSGSPISANARITTPIEDFETAELTLTHDGKILNFRSTAVFKSPITDTIDAEASLRYVSLLTLDGMVSLTSNIQYMRNLKLAARMSERRGQQSSHLELTWDPSKQIIMDGTYRYQDGWSEKQLTADVSLSTPFEIARQAAFRLEHTEATDKYAEKIGADYNGNTVLDMDMEYTQSDKREGTITVREPRPMQFTVSGLVGDTGFDGDMFVNWDRDEPESNIRVTTIYADRGGSGMTDKDIKVKLIHPRRTMGIEASAVNSPRQTKSRGELIWNEDTGTKLSYDFNLHDRSRRYSTIYDGNFKIGFPRRSIQTTGSYSESGSTKSIDGSLFWDADRDQNKEIGFKTVFTPDDTTTKTDVTLRFPSVGKDLKIGTEMTMNDGRTLFLGKTEVSYSSDSRKTLTLLSKVEDISIGYGTKNYSLVLGITHPYTDVDAQVTSHIGSSSEHYSAGMGLMYLTARRERKNIALRAEINRLRRQIEIEIITPIKKIEISGEVVNTNPYQLILRNRYDDSRTINADMTVDTERRFFTFQTNYDLENPGNTIHLGAKYVNDNAIQAEIYRRTNYRRQTDSLMAVRLNTSRILHTRLHWRPEIVQEFQEFTTAKVEKYGKAATVSFYEISNGIGHELSGKFGRITKAASEELSPLVDLLEQEMENIERQLEGIKRDIRRMYRRNDFYLQDMGETYLSAFEKLKQIISAYRSFTTTVSENIADWAEQVKSFPIRQTYDEFVNEYIIGLRRMVEGAVDKSVELISLLDDKLRDMRGYYQYHLDRLQNSVAETLDSIRNHPHILRIQDGFGNYQQYIDAVTDKVKYGITSTGIPEKYNSLISNANQILNSGLSDIMHQDDVRYLKSMANNAYQEGLWAYRYWQVEENIKKHLKSILEILKEMVEEEIEEYKSHFLFLERSKFTVYDPEHGEIQMELYLPIPLRSLDSLPEMDKYIETAEDIIDGYTPSKATLMKYYDNVLEYLPSWNSTPTNETTEEDKAFNNQFQDYLRSGMPTRARRLPRGRYRGYQAQRL